jgi:L-lactate dehydrogenase complex protein LldG
MSSRDAILAAIRSNKPHLDRALPEVPLFNDDPRPPLIDMFKENLQRMGGIFLDPVSGGDPLAPVRE